MHRIIIVDDEDTIIDITKKYLAKMGNEVVGTAVSGNGAVEKARQLKPDLILMDISMPGKIDGITAAEIIKAELNIPVIFVSGYTDEEIIDRAKRVDPLGFIVKPVQYAEFKVAIEMAFYKNEVEQKLRKSDELEKTNELLQQEIAERKQAEKALKQSETELWQLSSRLLEAHEEESRRIGLELHDGLAQTLSAIKVWAESALVQMNHNNSAELAGSLESVISLVKGAVEEVRRISRHLRPSILDDLGILATMSWLCQEFETLYPEVTIEKHVHIQENNVPESLKIVIYRILQEAMNNISKHSKAEFVQIELKAIDGRIELSIGDNGVGFDVESVFAEVQSEKGLGLTSMKERTELSGGTFAIKAAKGNGTDIRASWQT